MPALINCYNRGCGQKFDPSDNTADTCIHHPGVPFFHDAYKGWSCCNKKSVDFTEFLNIKGCTQGKHSNEKPPEPEKSSDKDVVYDEPPPQKIPEPIRTTLQRPPWESPLITMVPIVAPAFKNQIDNLPVGPAVVKKISDPTEIQPGTACKHGGCTYSFEGTKNDEKPCVFHPGVPIFHEGLKFWSCCQKRTSDFTAFMNQVGCETGNHKWTSDEEESKAVKCRMDWHQTATQVVVTVYAKMYHYQQSVVRLNPIRLSMCLVFPQQNNHEYNVDLELRGVVDVAQSKVHMFGTKVEVTLIKAEPGTWAKLDFPREKKPTAEEVERQLQEQQKAAASQDDSDESDVDLDSIEPSFSRASLKEVK
ncbi:cysteine and histidine-rich domain-containing protein morgana [Armigeres subalbatus]|uniref:cysteine and histidine-rich domain-containing protein morgana n=1 Tax=Armigeres subalbatus TaxID=124917 RepID=UPI002ED1A8E5